MKYFSFFSALTFLLVSCLTPKEYNKFQKKQNAKNNVNLNEVRINPSTKSVAFRTFNKSIDLIHMDLDVKFNWGLHECIGKASIQLKPYYYETDSIVLNAKNMIFGGIDISDQDGNKIQYLVDYNKEKLRLKLERKFTANEIINIVINYVAHPDEMEGQGSKAIRGEKGLYFINTDNSEKFQPIQLWTQGETEANSCWFPTVDIPDEKFTSTLTISANKELTILSNGELISSETNGNTITQKWNNPKPMPAYLIMMAIGNFQKTESSINNKEVSYYLEPEFSPHANSIFAHTTEMIDFYSSKLGVDYPWNKYAQVVVRDYVSGAMENTSATLHGEFVQKNPRELLDGGNEGIVSHELFHQWFGDLVTCKNWSHLVLNEGFASFGEQLWNEYKYGRNGGLKSAYNSMNKYLNYVSKNVDGPIVDFNYKSQEDMFNAITYQKGARVINLLRNELGDIAFFEGLKNYLTKYAYSNAEIDDLRNEFELLTGRDLNPFFQQWFYKGGHPEIEIRYSYNDSMKATQVVIEQIQPREIGVYNFPLQFRVTQGPQTKKYSFQISRRKEVFYVKKLNPDLSILPNIIVDPEGIFVGEIKDNCSVPQLLQTYNDGASNYIEKVRALDAMSKIQNQLDTIRSTISNAMHDENDDIRLKALEWYDWKIPNSINSLKQKLIDLSSNDKSSQVRARATEILGLSKDSQLVNHFKQLVSDSSYQVAGEALKAWYKLQPLDALHHIPNIENDAKGNLFNKIAAIYIQSKRPEDEVFFDENMDKVFGTSAQNL
jgi:aminopeptidase N